VMGSTSDELRTSSKKRSFLVVCRSSL
jgi:hypothetical protein